MTLAHFIYIPAVLLVGIVIGWILGGRAVQMRNSDAAAVDKRREARRARRQAASAPPPE